MGMNVVGCARNMDKLRALGASISESGGSFTPIRCDVTDESQVIGMFKRVRAELGGVDVLVNNAGHAHTALIHDGKTADWRSMLDLNVVALCVCTREAVADMRSRGAAGHIINLSSYSGHRIVSHTSGFYAATKYAVRALTEALRRELRDLKTDIRATQISPGLVRTEFAERWYESSDKAASTYESNPHMTASDIVDIVVFTLNAPQRMEVHDVLVRPTQQLL